MLASDNKGAVTLGFTIHKNIALSSFSRSLENSSSTPQKLLLNDIEN